MNELIKVLEDAKKVFGLKEETFITMLPGSTINKQKNVDTFEDEKIYKCSLDIMTKVIKVGK